jgi:hypothetical protein
LKSELAAIDRKIQLSLQPIEQGEEKSTVSTGEDASRLHADHVQAAAGTVSGLMNGRTVAAALAPVTVPSRLQAAQAEPGDRLVIARPKFRR